MGVTGTTAGECVGFEKPFATCIPTTAPSAPSARHATAQAKAGFSRTTTICRSGGGSGPEGADTGSATPDAGTTTCWATTNGELPSGTWLEEGGADLCEAGAAVGTNAGEGTLFGLSLIHI